MRLDLLYNLSVVYFTNGFTNKKMVHDCSLMIKTEVKEMHFLS